MTKRPSKKTGQKRRRSRRPDMEVVSPIESVRNSIAATTHAVHGAYRQAEQAMAEGIRSLEEGESAVHRAIYEAEAEVGRSPIDVTRGSLVATVEAIGTAHEHGEQAIAEGVRSIGGGETAVRESVDLAAAVSPANPTSEPDDNQSGSDPTEAGNF